MNNTASIPFGVITLNPAIDCSLTLRHSLRSGDVHRVDSEKRSFGGKGINVARLIAGRGCKVLAGGLVGRKDLQDLNDSLSPDIATCFLPVESETRRNLMILAGKDEYKINRPGFPDLAYSRDQIRRAVRRVAEPCDVLIVSGALPINFPPDTYASLLQGIHAMGRCTVLDASGEELVRAVRSTRPGVIKPNREEAETLIGRPIRSERDFTRAMLEFMSMAETTILSDGPRGAWFGSEKAGLWRVSSPPATRRDTTAAGDYMLAQFCVDYFSIGLTKQTMARSVAAGAAAVELPGADCPSTARIDELAKRCEIYER